MKIISIKMDKKSDKATQDALKKNQEILKATFNALPDMNFRLDKNHVFLDYYGPRNEAKSLVAPPEFFIGKGIDEVLPPYICTAIRKNLDTAISTQKVQSFEYPLHIGDSLHFYEARISPINTQEVIVVVRDMTALKTAQKNLQDKINELNRQKTELEKYSSSNLQLENFAHTVSHDLREPVRTMNSFAQLLKRRYSDKLDADAHDYLDFISSAASHMNKLITDLLEYSSISHGEEEIVMKTIDLKSVVEAVVDKLTDSIQEAGAEVVINGSLPTINGDITRILRLFQNLISNAIKFQHEGNIPYIEIAAYEEKEHWCITVSDNGIGIPEENFENIFVLFRRLHSKRVYPGSGIGLTHCKRIIELHGGKIWVDSQLDAGSTFTFTIAK